MLKEVERLTDVKNEYIKMYVLNVQICDPSIRRTVCSAGFKSKPASPVPTNRFVTRSRS